MYAVWVAGLLLLNGVCLTWATENVVYAQVGEPVTLSRGEIPKDTYRRWFFKTQTGGDYAEVFFRHSMGNTQINDLWKNWIQVSDSDSLTIRKVNDSNFGSFKYELKQQNVVKESVYKLLKATLSPYPSSPVLHGDTLTLACSVQDSPKPERITWIPPETVDNARKTSVSGQNRNLKIEQVSCQDKGVWTCSMLYKGISSNLTIAIDVVDLSPAPPESIYTSTFTGRLQLPCTLCSAVEWQELRRQGLAEGKWTHTRGPGLDGDPKASPRTLASLSPDSTPPQWHIPAGSGVDGSALQKANPGNDLSLSKKVVTAQDRGTYTCALSFNKGVRLERSVKVEVLQLLAQPNSTVSEGRGLNLSCSLGGHEGLDELKVKWIPPKGAVPLLPPLASLPQTSFFSIPTAALGHSGPWKCELWRNDTLLTYASLSVKIERVPVDVWLWVGIASAGLVVILLIFIARSLVKRFRQRRPPRRKTRFCCCNNPKPQKGFYRT